MNIHKAYLLFISALMILPSCTKTPGEGGRASIKGYVETIRRVQLNDPASNPDTIPASDAEVFIIYGDNTSPDDRVFTNPDGDYAFNWLRTGDYTIYVYSEDTSSVAYPLPKVAISTSVTIDDRKEVVDAGTITIYDEK
tara:strand:- start:1372 stop:1788 length:417 start_codon:yes stop_codon:yes gene_type:complete